MKTLTCLVIYIKNSDVIMDRLCSHTCILPRCGWNIVSSTIVLVDWTGNHFVWWNRNDSV